MENLENEIFYKTNEVCSLVNIKSYVLRFWESEFVEISQTFNSDGVRVYKNSDLETLIVIRKKLFEEKKSIQEVKEFLKNGPIEFEGNEVLENTSNEISKNFENQHNFENKNDVSKLKNSLMDILIFTKTLQEKHHWA